jgi:hypothetical protein
MEHWSDTFFMDFVRIRIGIMMGDNSEEQAELGKEIHVLSCASKPIGSWIKYVSTINTMQGRIQGGAPPPLKLEKI